MKPKNRSLHLRQNSIEPGFPILRTFSFVESLYVFQFARGYMTDTSVSKGKVYYPVHMETLKQRLECRSLVWSGATSALKFYCVFPTQETAFSPSQ